MFTYTNFLEDNLEEPPKALKLGRRGSTIPKPLPRIERPVSGSHAGKKPKTPVKPIKDNSVSEKYTNRAYNRLPSPRERFQTLASASKGNRSSYEAVRPSAVEERRNIASEKCCERVQFRSSGPQPFYRTLPVKQSYSDMLNKKRPLEAQCIKSNVSPRIEQKVRPKTSDCPRTESRLEHKVLCTVKNILSQAVMQQGKIDETNIDNVIDSMKNSLEKTISSEEVEDINIESKPSRTTVNEINLSQGYSGNKKAKTMAGIVRKENLSSKPVQKPYRKIYDQIDSTRSKVSINKNASEGDGESLIYIDIPDLDCFNFNPSMKVDEKTKVKPKIGNAVSKHNVHILSSSKRNEFSKQFEVGDFQAKEENRFWNSYDDEKLHAYVDSLIQNMNCQMKKDFSVMETDGEIDSHGTVCKSFCICKVCVSKNSQSKAVLKQKPSTQENPPVVVIEKPKSPMPVVRRPIRSGQKKPEIQQGANNRLRLMKPSSNNMETVIRNTNPNFKPEESSLNTSLNLPSVNKGMSYTVVGAPKDHEYTDDMYLKCRCRRSPNTRTGAKATK